MAHVRWGMYGDQTPFPKESHFIFGALAKLQKATIRFITPVSPSA
jgi:hypothetical protein